jgi:hypothetical protein
MVGLHTGSRGTAPTPQMGKVWRIQLPLRTAVPDSETLLSCELLKLSQSSCERKKSLVSQIAHAG